MSYRPTARIFALLFFVGFPLISGSVGATPDFSRVVIFGDSLSDTGNIAGALTPNLPSPYFQNRISNGLLAVDILTQELGTNARAAAEGGDNWSIVGGNIVGQDIGDLSRQIDRYLARDGQRDDRAALFVIFLGGNDLRDLRGVTNSVVAQSRLVETVNLLANAIDRLRAVGAMNFLVVNVPDIGRIPQTLEREPTDPGVSTRVSTYVNVFNGLLASKLEELAETRDSQIYLLDLYSTFTNVLNNPAAFNFTITDRGCFDPNDGINPLDFAFDEACDSGLYPFVPPDFTGFVFFDSLHPTAAMHALVGGWLVKQLEQGPLSKRRVNLGGVLQLLLDE